LSLKRITFSTTQQTFSQKYLHNTLNVSVIRSLLTIIGSNYYPQLVFTLSSWNIVYVEIVIVGIRFYHPTRNSLYYNRMFEFEQKRAEKCEYYYIQ